MRFKYSAIVLFLICFSGSWRTSSAHSVTFDLGDHGTLLSGSLAQSVDEGSTAIAPEISVDDGWAFTGWDTSFYHVTGDLTVTAQYLPESLAGILEQKVLASDGAASDVFGSSVGVSGDTAVVGAYRDENNQGNAYVFVRDGNTWIEQAKLTASDGAENDFFGRSVSVSGDTVIIGAYLDDDQGSGSGSAYIFVRNGDMWFAQSKLTASDGAESDFFGWSVSISGGTALIGAKGDDDRGTSSGSAYVFVRNGSVWAEQAKLTASDGGVNDSFGMSVDLSGETAVIGADRDSDQAFRSGSACVFVRNGSTWTEQAKLLASDGATQDYFGQSVSISGNTVVIGAYGNNDQGDDSGSAYVFVRNESMWMEQAKLLASDGATDDRFGFSVDVSGDVAVIGAFRSDDQGTDSGSGYVFVRNGSTWGEQSKLTASDGAVSDSFGQWIGLSGDIAVIGAPGDDDQGSSSGSAYFYDIGVPPASVTFDLGVHGTRTGGGELSQLVVAGTAAIAPTISAFSGFEFMGWDLDFSSISSDLTITAQYLPSYSVTFDLGSYGTLLNGSLVQSIIEGHTAISPEFSVTDGWAFVGWDKSYHDVNENLTVTAQYFQESLVSVFEDKVLASNGGYHGDDFFGYDVSISGDTAVIGAYGDDDNGSNSGSAYVFLRIGSSWVQQAKLTPSDGSHGDYFGYSVSVSGDTAVIGAYGDNDDGSDSGSAYVFIRNGSMWVEQAKLLASDGAAGEEFGWSVSVSGELLVIGARRDDDNGSYSGSAYVFARDESVWTEQAKLTASDGAENDYFGFSVSVSGQTAVIGAYGNDGQGLDSGNAYVFIRNGSAWIEQAILTASDAAASDQFGGSVSVSGETAVISASGNDDHGNSSGSAYIFVRNGSIWTEQVKLTANDGATSDYFGDSVSLSGDTAVIGAIGDDDNGSNSGSAYVFTRSGNVWLEQTKLTASDGSTSDYFGRSVSVSGDSALIGAPQSNDLGSDSGSGYFYDLGFPPFAVTFELGEYGMRTGGGELVQLVKISNVAVAPSVSVAPGFGFVGWDVDFSSVSEDLTVTAIYAPIFTVTFDLDGKGVHSGGGELSQLIVGGSAAVAPIIMANSSWVFTGWDVDFSSISSDLTVTALYESPYTVTFDLGPHGMLLSGSLVQSIAEGATAIAPELTVADGWAFIGWDKSFHDVTGDFTVTAQYISESLAGIVEKKVLASDGAASDNFGLSVSVSGDTVVIGAKGDDDQGSSSGSAYVFVRDGSSWIEQAKLTASDGTANDYFGESVSVSGDTAVIGAYWDDDLGDYSGSAYVFVRNGSTWIEQAKLTASDGITSDYFGSSVSVSGDTAVIGAYGDDDLGRSSGSAYVFVRSGNIWTEQAKLMAGDGVANDYFGLSVSVSGDTAVIGAYWDDDQGSNSGSAYVFYRSEGSWIEQTKLTASDGVANDYFGHSISVSEDTAVIGVYGDDDQGSNSGSTYIFVRSGNTWTEQAKLTASDGATNDRFGLSVYVSGDITVIGANNDDDKGTNSGSAYVFVRNGSTWTERTKLTASDGAASDYFGSSVSVSGDTAVIGSYGDDDLESSSGSAYIYDLGAPPFTVTFDLGEHGSRTGGGELVQSVVAGTAAIAPTISVVSGFEFTGWDVDFSSVSSDIVVTAQILPVHSVTFDLGSHGTLLNGFLDQSIVAGSTAIAPESSVVDGWAFVGWDKSYHNVTEDLIITAQYTPESLVGILEQKGLASDGDVLDEFGYSVSVSGDTAIIGAYRDDDYIGSAYIFIRNGSTWTEQAKLTVGDGVTREFGWSVSVSGDTAVVGAHLDSELGSASGSAYVFVRNGSTWIEQTKLTASDGEAGDDFGYDVSLSGDTVVIGAYGDDDNGSNSGSAYVFARDGINWVEQAKLTANDGASNDHFGRSVSVSGDSAVIGASLDDDRGSNSGSAYVFVRVGSTWTEQAKLTAGDGAASDYFGQSVSVSGDTVVIGARGDDDQGSDSGSAYVFVRNGSTWTEQAKLTAGDGAVGDSFGRAVSVSGDTAVIGADRDDDQGSSSGSTYVFIRNGSAWSEQSKLTASDGTSSDYFGNSVSVNGDTAVIGAYLDDDYDSGSAYFYDLGVPPATVNFELGEHGTRTGGGELSQLVRVGDPAVAPTIDLDPGWLWGSWDSDFSFVTEDLTVTAIYIDEDDQDGDIMEDAWEITYFGSADARDGMSDSDGDGQLDVEEFITGDDPTDPTRYFYVMNHSFTNGIQEVTLTFTSNDDRSDRRYVILYTEDLKNGPWLEAPLGPIMPDAGSSTTRNVTLPITSQSVFLKIGYYLE